MGSHLFPSNIPRLSCQKLSRLQGSYVFVEDDKTGWARLNKLQLSLAVFGPAGGSAETSLPHFKSSQSLSKSTSSMICTIGVGADCRSKGACCSLLSASWSFGIDPPSSPTWVSGAFRTVSAGRQRRSTAEMPRGIVLAWLRALAIALTRFLPAL